MASVTKMPTMPGVPAEVAGGYFGRELQIPITVSARTQAELLCATVYILRYE